ncbi:MAG: sugar porter family MFS transporter [Janthinobacterium lividum]
MNYRLIGGIVAAATIGGFMFGYDSGVVNGTTDGLKQAFQLDPLALGGVVAAILIGSSFGAFFAGRLSDIIGRRSTMMLAAVLFIISGLLAGAANSAHMFVLARILGGLGVGAASVTSPVYISEVVPASVRGRLTSVQQVMIISGLTGAFIANYFLAKAAGGSAIGTLWAGYPAWRWMYWLQVIPATVYFVALLFIPESPRFLVARGHEDRAQGVLSRLIGPIAARQKVADIRASFASDHHKPKLSDLIDKQTGRVRPILWAGIGLAVFQQLVGINVIFYYGAKVWQAAGFTEQTSLFMNGITGFLSIPACFLSLFLVDRVGRKPLLLIGSVGMTVTLAIVGFAFSTGSLVNGTVVLPGSWGMILFVSALAYTLFFNASWGPVMWVMLGEMFPNQIRGSGLAVAGFAQWIANAAISVSFPVLLVWPGLSAAYYGYAFFALLSFFFTRAMVHETKGRELEDMLG